MDELPLHNQNLSSFDRLRHVVATLRGIGGCPWDIKQTPMSLKKYLLEECTELIEAIDKGSEADVREEIGDIFFILTLLTSIFSEQQRFTIDDALDDVAAKMVRRHPHVFGDAEISDEQELRAQWERIKHQEKHPSPPLP